MNYFNSKLREPGYINYIITKPDGNSVKYWWDTSGKFWTIALYDSIGNQIDDCDHAGYKQGAVMYIEERLHESYQPQQD